jgi:hypothetical protein
MAKHFLLVLLVMIGAARADAVDLYVAPNGSDSNPGTEVPITPACLSAASERQCQTCLSVPIPATARVSKEIPFPGSCTAILPDGHRPGLPVQAERDSQEAGSFPERGILVVAEERALPLPARVLEEHIVQSSMPGLPPCPDATEPHSGADEKSVAGEGGRGHAHVVVGQLIRVEQLEVLPMRWTDLGLK